jgi:hypothetical protein
LQDSLVPRRHTTQTCGIWFFAVKLIVWLDAMDGMAWLRWLRIDRGVIVDEQHLEAALD